MHDADKRTDTGGISVKTNVLRLTDKKDKINQCILALSAQKHRQWHRNEQDRVPFFVLRRVLIRSS